ncbi:MAG: hemolysin III family protein [Bdellovibrionaceae bacterium]|nr:hemolysin III family protein [Pseudobdellovibrionaceae bacterium]
MSDRVSIQKPRLRGYLHQEAFFIALGACVLLVAKSSHAITFVAALVYSLGLLMMLGVSSIYHRIHWQPKSRALLKRLDHSAIFVQIAGTFTPICLLALDEKNGGFLLKIIWASALAGILQSIFWVKAPKYVTALFYVVMGWLALPYVSQLSGSLGPNKVVLLVAGGVVYTIGSIFYATKRPHIYPHIFGYHELFHLFTIVGAILHFIVIYQLIN